MYAVMSTEVPGFVLAYKRNRQDAESIQVQLNHEGIGAYVLRVFGDPRGDE